MQKPLKHIFDGFNFCEVPNIDISGLLESCESLIETYFIEECLKHINRATMINGQVNFETSKGIKRIDFVLTNSQIRMGIECDGSEFHDFESDLIRDYFLIKEKHLDCIFRFRGTDLYKYPEICLWFISHEYPEIFSKHGQEVLENSFKLHPQKPYLPERPPQLDLVALYDSSQTIMVDFVRRNNLTFEKFFVERLSG
jgi:hypothetical protein